MNEPNAVDANQPERDARLATMLTHAAVGLSEMTMDGRFLYVNAALAAMYGRPAEALVGTRLSDWTNPDDREAADALVARVAAFGELETVEKRFLHGNGTRFDARTTMARFETAQGEPRLLALTVETTHRRQAERGRHQAEEQFYLLAESVRDYAMMVMDADGTITAWNIGAERLLGWSEAEAIGRNGAMIFTPEDRAAGAHLQEMATAAAAGRAEDERWHVRKDNSRFWGSGVMSAARNADGSLRALVKVMRDQTARKAQEEALQQTVAMAEVANRSKDDFLATISHELRTPLSAIMIWTKLLSAPTISVEDRDEGLRAIQQSADAQKQLIDDLLDSSRITSGKMRLEMTQVPLLPLVQSAIDTIEPTADAKGIQMTVDLDEQAGVVRADPDRLRQIVWNLLTNAVKFTPTGGKVEVGLWRRGGDVEIRVLDTGRGIDPSFLPHVFERFSQSDAGMTRTSGGLGLGLAIVKQLVELHGGTISVESAGVDHGTIFRVKLPLRAIRQTESRRAVRTKPIPPAARGEPESASVRNALPGMRVLVVEDQPTPRAAICVLLSAAGATAVDVGTAAEALEAVKRQKFDLLLSDIGLPGIDGYELMRQIRQQEAASGTPRLSAVALTAFAGEEDEASANTAGYDRYLSKPFTTDALIAVIQSLAKPA